jgi:hypothetical protein
VKRTVSWSGRHDFRGTEPIATADTPRSRVSRLPGTPPTAALRLVLLLPWTGAPSKVAPAPTGSCLLSSSRLLLRTNRASWLIVFLPKLILGPVAFIPSPSPSVAPQIPILCKSTRGPPISSVFSLALCVSVSTHPPFPQWIASTACSSSSCKAIGGGNLFNPSDAVQTGFSFNITYLQGTVAGPIIWDQVGVGGYNIDNQALCASLFSNFASSFSLACSCGLHR